MPSVSSIQFCYLSLGIDPAVCELRVCADWLNAAATPAIHALACKCLIARFLSVSLSYGMA